MPGARAVGDTITLTNGQMLNGIIISQSAQGTEMLLVPDQGAAAPGERRIRVPADEIVDIINTIDVKRLEQLRPDSPKPYLELAEILASYPQDAAAQQTARRLYLIAASLSVGKTRRSALLGLLYLTPPEQQMPIRQLAWEFDIDHERFEFALGRPPAHPWDRWDEATRSRLSTVCRLLRNRQFSEAGAVLDAWPKFSPTRESVFRFEFYQMARDIVRAQQVTETQLLQLLQLEVTLARLRLDQPLAFGWNQQMQIPASVDAPTLGTITEFDPKQNRFIDYRWTAEEE